jgi:tight adherence protein B
MIAAELGAGSSEADALGAAAATDRRLVGAAAAARPGDLDAVVRHLAERPDTRGLAMAWRVRQRTGAPLVDAIRLVEADADARAVLRRTVEEILAGPRASALLLALLPLIGIVLAAQMGAAPLHFLLRTGPGAIVLLIGVGLDAIGLVWTNRLAVRAGSFGADHGTGA